MRSTGHPCHKTPDYWRAARREYRRLHVVMTWLGWLGLLHETLFPTRWLKDQLRVLERGLRGLLVLGAPRQTPTTSPETNTPSLKRQSHRPLGPDASDPNATDAFRIRRARFSLSLKDYGSPNAPSGPVGQDGVAADVAYAAPGGQCVTSKSKGSDLLARLDAVGHALAHAESYVVRMAQRLAARGLRVRRQVLSPANWTGFSPGPGWPHELEARLWPVPILDSS